MKTKMNPYKRMIGSLMIGLQVIGIAFADVGASSKTDDLQEQVLIANLVGLTAQKISEKDFQSKVLPVVNAYEQASPSEGRSDRFAQAMVEMNMMTAARADEVKASIDATVGAQLNANPNMNQDQRNQLVMTATLQQMNLSSVGAQFSSATCTGFWIGGSAIIVASIFANVYASTLTHSTSQTTASGSEQGSGTSTSSTSGNSGSTTTTTVSGTTTTASSSVTSNETEKKLLITSAAIGYGIAGTLFILALVDSDSGCN